MNHFSFIPQKSNLPMSLENYLIYLETIKGKSPNTITAYKKDLIIFYRFLKAIRGITNDAKTFEAIDLSDIDDNFNRQITLLELHRFLYYVEKERNNGSYARARKVATLKSYFNYLCNIHGSLTTNPCEKLESPDKIKRQPIYLSLEQSITVLNSLDSRKANYKRDYCIFVLFLNCGLRLSELCSIRISKIRNESLTIIGKGNKERTVYLNEACINAITDYLKERESKEIPEDYKDFLFLSTRKRPINPRTVEIMIKKHIVNSNIAKADTYTPHKLRHTAATLLYQEGVDIRKLQAILGHESVSTTEIYTHLQDSVIKEAVNQNPLAKFQRSKLSDE